MKEEPVEEVISTVRGNHVEGEATSSSDTNEEDFLDSDDDIKSRV